MATIAEVRPFGDPQAALQLAQKAPVLLASASSVASTFPLSLISPAESPETWMDLAQLFYACLRTGDDKSAHLCLEKLTQRFGAENDKIMGMRGMYQEATAPDNAALMKILQEYTKICNDNPMNLPIHKRRISLIRSIGRPQEAITALTELLDCFPSDIEAWCELSDLYQSQGMASQAIFSLEEALLTVPNAWNLHAKAGELDYMNATSGSESVESTIKSLVSAIQRFSRSIELCDDYLRGYYGLKLAVNKLAKVSSGAKPTSDSIAAEKLQKLDKLATSKLRSIIKARNAASANSTVQAEIIAAQELLDRSKS
jgi:ER membrane protein complex subunit 2